MYDSREQGLMKFNHRSILLAASIARILPALSRMSQNKAGLRRWRIAARCSKRERGRERERERENPPVSRARPIALNRSDAYRSGEQAEPDLANAKRKTQKR